MDDNKQQKLAEAPELTIKGRKLRQQWIAALESGRYKQGRAALRQRNKEGQLEYCCFGVLCNIKDKSQWQKKQVFSGKTTCAFNYAQEPGYPPTQYSNEVGLNADQIEALIKLNDEHKLSFKEIANRLKTNNFSSKELSNVEKKI